MSRYNWTGEQIDAINRSLNHWRENLEGLRKWDKQGYVIYKNYNGFEEWHAENVLNEEIYFDASHCRLCQVSDFDPPCRGCPLKTIGQKCGRSGSAWMKCKKASSNSEIISAAENMGAVLEGLLK